MISRIRNFLRSDMRVLRWVFAALYAMLLATLFAPLVFESDTVLAGVMILAIMLGTQALFIFGAGTIELCRPIRRRRLLLPVIVAATLFTVLAGGAIVALMELLNVGEHPGAGALIMFLLVGNWTLWFVMFLIRARVMERHTVLARLTAAMFAGSLLELMVTVPSHVVVSRRPGCLVGAGTMLGIIAGVLVMTWSFGPAIVLLFLRPRLRRERQEWSTRCEHCGYDLRASIPAGSSVCPECGSPIHQATALCAVPAR